MWCHSQFRVSGIRNKSRLKLMDNIFMPLKEEHKWKILIVDDLAMNILSACFKTEEILKHNIALIESIDKKRESMLYFSAIYIVLPNVKVIEQIIEDFHPKHHKYQSAHLFFLHDIPNELFDKLCSNQSSDFIKTVKEVHMLYVPCESQVFSLEESEFYPLYFDAFSDLNLPYCQSVAQKLVTLISTMEVIPSIRYRRKFIKNLVLAEEIQTELNRRKTSLPHADDVLKYKRCELLILDRGFDCISPIIHEYTLQAMAYDLLDIKDDLYQHTMGLQSENSTTQMVSLTEDDLFWRILRHEHIVNVAKIIEDVMKDQKSYEPSICFFKRFMSLAKDIRKHFKFHKNQTLYVYRHMANECMMQTGGDISNLADLEQNLALRCTHDGKQLKQPILRVMKRLKNEHFDMGKKIRLFLLYIFYTKGISRKTYEEILKSCEIAESDVSVIPNFMHLDIDVFKPDLCEPTAFVPKGSIGGLTFKQSRWVPILKNIILSCIQNNLNEDKYPFIAEPSIDITDSSSPRTDCRNTENKEGKISCLIIFIAGGVTYSEMRCVYEMMAVHSGWDIIIGGDSLITPNSFLKKLESLPSFKSN